MLQIIALVAGLPLRPSRLNSLSLEVRLEGRWNHQATVRLLIRLNQRHKQPSKRCAASVQQMREFILARLPLEAQVHPARLEVFAVRDARNFKIAPLPWRPHFEVVSLRA